MVQGPAVPSFIFRGHGSSVHSLHFLASNQHLVSGDSDGWIVVWKLSTKRPVAVWKGHKGGVMGLRDWNEDWLISHGRDHEVRVWQLRDDMLEGMNVKLPVDGADADESKWPWLLFSFAANALNYCAFTVCDDSITEKIENGATPSKSYLLASPNGLDTGGIDIFDLPSGRRLCQLTSDKTVQTGMVMALSLIQRDGKLILVSGYETGHIITHIRISSSPGAWKWAKIACSQPHTQPVLAIDTTRDGRYMFSSSADAIISRCEISSEATSDRQPDKIINTKHAGQQDLKIRDDGKIFATAGWDARVRVYSVKTMKELAVLKWHQEGCSAIAFANTIAAVSPSKAEGETSTTNVLVKSTLELLKDEREAKMKDKHWLAAGGKDGKISLWEVY